jgi:hypothetical protein
MQSSMKYNINFYFVNTQIWAVVHSLVEFGVFGQPIFGQSFALLDGGFHPPLSDHHALMQLSHMTGRKDHRSKRWLQQEPKVEASLKKNFLFEN